MEFFTRIWQGVPAFETLRRSLEEGRVPLACYGLSTVHKANLIAALYAETGRQMLVLVPDERAGERMVRNLNTMIGGEAAALYREILEIQVDFFSNMHLRELPYYQAMAARKLGQEQRACAILAPARRAWAAELERVDNGFFSTTPFFISFTDDPAQLRRAQYLYLLALAELFQGQDRRAGELFRESLALNSDNLFCGYFAP